MAKSASVRAFPLGGHLMDYTCALRLIVETEGLVKAGQYIKKNVPEQFHEHFKRRAVEIKNEES